MYKYGYEITEVTACGGFAVTKDGVTEVFDDLADAIAYVNYKAGIITAREYVVQTMYKGWK